MPPENIDLLISAGWIIPIQPENAVYSDCAVAISGGNILAVLPIAEANRRFTPDRRLDLPNHVLTPGLVNAHGHAAMTLLRGYADDLALHTWLKDKIWPTEGRWVSEDFVRDGTEIAIAEMIRSGTTCFSDQYFYPHQAGDAAREAGIRCQLAFPVVDFPTNWARDAEEHIHKGLALRDDFGDDGLVFVAIGPHSPYALSDKPLERIGILAGEIDAAIQIHLHETAAEVKDSLREHGIRPIERLFNLGIITPQTQCVHMTQADDTDIGILARSGAHVVHCPKSNLKLASGYCPVQRLREAGVNVALGTDGAASNNSLDMFGELQVAAMLSKAVSGNPAALDAHSALRMATLDGARALGRDHLFGSIEAGKAADLIAVDLGDIEQEPLYHPASQLVYTQSGHRVTHVWVNGKSLLDNRVLQTINIRELQAKARQWRERIAND